MINETLIRRYKPQFHIFPRSLEYILLIAFSVFLACVLPSLPLLYSFIIMTLFIGTILAVSRPKLYFLGILVTLPVISLTYNIRVQFFGFNSRVGTSGLNFQSFIVTYSLIIFMYYFFSGKSSEKTIFNSPILKPMLCFLLINLLGLFLTVDLSKAIPNFLRVISGPLIFLTAFIFLDRKDTINKFMYLLMIFLFIPIAMGYLEMLGIIPYKYSTVIGTMGIVERVTCGYKHPLTIWNFMFFYYPFLFFLYGLKSNFKRNLLLIFAFLLPLPILYLSYYRTGLLIFFVEVLLWNIFKKKEFRASLTVAIAAVFIFMKWRFFSAFYRSILIPFTTSPESTEFSLGFNYRIGVWIHYLDIFKQQYILNKLFGMGPYMGDPHNNYIWILLATGIIGFGIYLWMLIAMFKETSFALNSSKDSYLSNFAIMMKVLFIAFLIISITTHPNTSVEFQLYFFAIFSILAKCNIDAKKGLKPLCSGSEKIIKKY